MQTILPTKYNLIEKPTATFFEKGEKIITHPSGVISKYNKTDIQRQKDNLLEQKQHIDKQLSDVEKDLTFLI